jgi:hypothetical protein
MQRKQANYYYVIDVEKAKTGWVRPHWTKRGSVKGFYRKKGIHKKIIPSAWRWFSGWYKKREYSPEGG